MADKAKKISELTALASGGLANDDVFAVVDTSASETKKITANSLYTYVYSKPTNLQISSLSSLTMNTVNLSDQLVIFDDSASDTKKITANELRKFYDDQASHLPTQRVSVGGDVVANLQCKVILCNSSSGNINLKLPLASDGKAFYVKNIGSGGVNVSSVTGTNVENSSGSLLTSVDMNGTGMHGYWVLDLEQACYRFFGGRIV